MTRRRRILPYATGICLAVTLVVTFAVSAPSTAAPTSAGAARNPSATTQIRIATTRPLARGVEEIIGRALAHLGPDAHIDVVTAVNAAREIASVEERAGRPEIGFPDIGPVWIVRGHGHFVGRHVPPGKPPFVSNTGYLLISDETGNVFGMGMP